MREAEIGMTELVESLCHGRVGGGGFYFILSQKLIYRWRRCFSPLETFSSYPVLSIQYI